MPFAPSSILVPSSDARSPVRSVPIPGDGFLSSSKAAQVSSSAAHWWYAASMHRGMPPFHQGPSFFTDTGVKTGVALVNLVVQSGRCNMDFWK